MIHGEGRGKLPQNFCLGNPMDRGAWWATNSMKRQKDITLKDELPRSRGAQYTTREEQRNSSRRNKKAEPNLKQCSVVDVFGGRSKVQCCKEQYRIGTWNVRFVNQSKLEVVKQEEVARETINNLGISELNGQQWLNSIQMTTISTTVGKNTLEEIE